MARRLLPPAPAVCSSCRPGVAPARSAGPPRQRRPVGLVAVDLQVLDDLPALVGRQLGADHPELFLASRAVRCVGLNRRGMQRQHLICSRWRPALAIPVASGFGDSGGVRLWRFRSRPALAIPVASGFSRTNVRLQRLPVASGFSRTNVRLQRLSVASGFSRTNVRLQRLPVASGFSRTNVRLQRLPVASGFSRTMLSVASGFSRTRTLSVASGFSRTNGGPPKANATDSARQSTPDTASLRGATSECRRREQRPSRMRSSQRLRRARDCAESEWSSGNRPRSPWCS